MAIYINEQKYTMAQVTGSSESPALGEKTVTENGTYNAAEEGLDGYSKVTVDVDAPTPLLQTKSVTPTESAQQIRADAGYSGLEAVTVAAVGSTYVGSGVVRQGAVTITPNDNQQTAAASGVFLTGDAVVAPVPAETYIKRSEVVTYHIVYDVPQPIYSDGDLILKVVTE